MKKLFFLPLLAALALPASAYEVGDEIDLTPYVRGEVTSVNGTNVKVNIYANPDNKPSGDLVIPYFYSMPSGDTVIPVQIQAEGFRGCELTSVTVTGIEYIGASAFYGCTKLKSFTETVPGTVESIGSSAFGHTSSLESISLTGVYTIQEWAFQLSGIKSAEFPNLMYLFGAGFYECANLETFIGGEKLVKIGNIAFCKDENLKYVTLGPDLKEIGSMAFAFCSSLEEVVLPESLTSVGNEAFSGLALKRLFILSPDFMDFCDASKVLRNKYMEKIYCPEDMVFEVKYYISTGSETNNPQFLASQAEVAPLSDIVELKQVEGDEFEADKKIEEITLLKVFNPENDKEIFPYSGIYTISGDKAILDYKVDRRNLLRYTTTLNRNTGVNDILQESDSKEARWYDLHGRQVNSPSKGVYILRNGSKVQKVIL